MVDVLFAPLHTLEEQVRRRMRKLSGRERVDMIARLLEGYCRHCGREEEEEGRDPRGCQCQNDE